MEVDANGAIYVSAMVSGTTNNYETLKYTEYTTNKNIMFDNNNEPLCKENELIVRFQESAIDANAIDNVGANKEIVFESIDYF